MSAIDISNSTVKLAGVSFDFRGYNAELTCNGKIIKVECIKTGKDCTKQFKDKYNQ